MGVFGAATWLLIRRAALLRLGAREYFDYLPAYFCRDAGAQRRDRDAREEGIKFYLLTSPKEIFSDNNGNVKGVICVKNELGEPDASGRRSPVPVTGSDFGIELDTIIVAIGTGADPLLIYSITGLKLNRRGYIEVDEKMQTAIEDIFAAGDIVSGSATVISAINQARTAAAAIIKKFNQ